MMLRLWLRTEGRGERGGALGSEWVEPHLLVCIIGGVDEIGMRLNLLGLLLVFVFVGDGLVISAPEPVRAVLDIIDAPQEDISPPRRRIVELVEIVQVVGGRVDGGMVQVRRGMGEVLGKIRRPELLAGVEMDQRGVVEDVLRDILQHPLVAVEMLRPQFLTHRRLFPASMLRVGLDVSEELLVPVVPPSPLLPGGIGTVMGKTAEAERAAGQTV